MPSVLLIVPSVADGSDQAIPAFVLAMQQAIVTGLATLAVEPAADDDRHRVELWLASELETRSPADFDVRDRVVCPLTWDLPDWFDFPGRATFAACRAIAPLRQQVTDWGYATGDGTQWLPIVATAKGALFGEVIAPAEDGSYHQPVHLDDAQRQPLYALGQRLLRSLHATPSVYLLQFGWQGDTLCFDRLIPFPDAPAIASLTVQQPHLFDCHWCCLTNQPVRELIVSA